MASGEKGSKGSGGEEFIVLECLVFNLFLETPIEKKNQSKKMSALKSPEHIQKILGLFSGISIFTGVGPHWPVL